MKDPLIVGGGPAGAAAAIVLAERGTRALVLDRNREAPDQLCGGFLGWDALGRLARLGIDVARLGARPVTRLRLVAGDRVVEATLPFPAAGLSRRTLDAALLDRAAELGVKVERGILVRSLSAEPLGARLVDGVELEADAIFLATGKHDLRGVARPAGARGADPAMGLRRRLTPSPSLAAALEGVIELHLFRGGYAGLLLQEDGAVNLCLSVAESRFAGAGGTADALLATLAEAPRLIERIGSATAGAPWQAVAGVPYGWRTATTTPGLFRLGDQAAVIASLAGDGVAIALASGCLAADQYATGGAGAAAAFQHRFARIARRPLRIAEMLRRVGQSPATGPLLALFGHIPGLPALLARATRIG